MHKINLLKRVQGKLHVRHYDQDGRMVGEQKFFNTLTFAAADIFMKALVRSGASQVTHLYARFGTDANPGYLLPSDSDMRSVTRSDFLAAQNSSVGGLWVTLMAAASLQPSDSNQYRSNEVTYYFRLPYAISADQISPAENFDPDNSKIFALGIAVAENSEDRSQDILITAAQAVGYDDDDINAGYFTAFALPPGGQSTVDYTLTFTAAD